MTTTELKAEIERLKDVVRYSHPKEANVAAMKIVGLQRELKGREASDG